jgi:hypothetical protein
MLPRRRLHTTIALTFALAALPTASAMAKGDRDGMPDRWEKRHRLNVRINDAARDKDRDGLTNYGEYRSHTNPRKKDSDRDRRGDAREDYDRDKVPNRQEIKTGNDAGDSDSDDDSISDGRENAGRITAVGLGSVQIMLSVGGNLTARLAPELSCATASATPWSDPAPAFPDGDAGGDIPEAGEDGELEDEPLGDDAAAEAAQVDEDADPIDDAAPDDGVIDPEAEACASALKTGAYVHEAEVMATSEGTILVTIDLVKK